MATGLGGPWTPADPFVEEELLEVHWLKQWTPE
jgi:hypothetical protein